MNQKRREIVLINGLSYEIVWDVAAAARHRADLNYNPLPQME